MAATLQQIFEKLTAHQTMLQAIAAKTENIKALIETLTADGITDDSLDALHLAITENHAAADMTNARLDVILGVAKRIRPHKPPKA